MGVDASLVFGPVPSRRLGRSLGINNVPAKTCSYGCVYCQVGPTTEYALTPRRFRDPERLVAAVRARVEELRRQGERIDALTFVPDGEPTLDADLGLEIERLSALGIPVAVISNGSLLTRPEVARALSGAAWVGLKVDTLDGRAWRRLDRPHPDLQLSAILEAVLSFAASFRGTLTTETMLVRGLNDGAEEIEALAEYLARVGPACAYLAVPTRPTAAPGVLPPGEGVLHRAFESLARRLPRVELLIGFEGDTFGTSGDPRHDLLSVAAVHPLREDQALAILEQDGAAESLLPGLVAEGLLVRLEHGGHTFYARRLARPGSDGGAAAG